ncbi:inositol polyphosphate 5-phosphatase K [Musca autumnalis]|uniref:inositol polyphosphate 5-phosphatase K n=1 Tax=Musca autumnalis TaxID=221902 RepID=UPI003CFA6E16
MSSINKDNATDVAAQTNGEGGGSSTTATNILSTQLATYRVFVVTWNVGSRFPDNISLRNLLGISNLVEDHHLPDIYAIGLQEVNVQPQQQVLGLFKEDPWTDKVKNLLKDFDYVLIKTEQMQGLLISLFVRRQHVPHLRDIEPEFTRTGFGGIWGNKGAVSVRFNLYGCALCFVVCHLAAHDHHLDERIEDFKQIMDNHHYHVPRYREIYDHDYVFLFGDLNFRLMGDDSSQEVRDKVIKDEALEELMSRDQLSYVRQQTQEAFQLLQERKPAFPPTFKFHEGTSEYNLKRRPAWTDRILYSVQPNNKQPNVNLEIEQCAYKSIPGYCISDHKPVTSEFTIKLYPNYRAPCVEFKDIAVWKIDEENTVEYKKPLDLAERDFDWIGIYPVNYASLKDYVCYEYVNKTESPPSTPDTNDPFWDNNPGGGGRRHRHRRRDQHRERVRRQQQANEELIRLEFDDDAELKDGEEYVLIYFHNTGLRGVSSVAGISNVFKAEKRPSTPRFSNVD